MQSAVPEQLKAAVVSFKQVFPDFDTDFEVYLLHSLKSMDGGTRKLNGKHTFIFGLDMIARFHPWEDETPFFHHELLHAYTKQLHVPTSEWYGSESLLLSLWEEGLAVYVSHLLNPFASYDDLTLDFPEGLRERTWNDRVFLAADLASDLTSTDEATNRRYFTPWTDDTRVPGRAGYFIGYVVVSELVKRFPLLEILRPTSKEELLERVRGQLLAVEALSEDAYSKPPLPRNI